MKRSRALLSYWVGLAIGAAALGPTPVPAADWPQWRYDARRSASSPVALPAELQLRWSRALPDQRPAWPDQPKMRLDDHYQPIVVGSQLIVASSFDDSVTAYDTARGDERWRFYASGPVRYAPVAANGKLYFAADDGYLYCLNAADGQLVWKFRGGPSDRRLLGNERMISIWPARGAPVVADGTVYFAAGIWPFMGIFLHAVDAETGRVVWTNSGDGSRYMKQPHQSDSFAGVAPQGPLTISGDLLLVPGGRSVPAGYDRRTGKLIYYELADNGKRGGGVAVAATKRLFFNGGGIFDLTNEKYLSPIGESFAFDDQRLFDYQNGLLRVLDLPSAGLKRVTTVDRKGQKGTSEAWGCDELGRVQITRLTDLIRAGSRLYAIRAADPDDSSARAEILALALPRAGDNAARIEWSTQLDETPVNLIAGDGKLFATTAEGGLYCFAQAETPQSPPRRHALLREPLLGSAPRNPADEPLASALAPTSGYVLIDGVGNLQRIHELLSRVALKLVIVEPDAQRAAQFRAQMTRWGLGSERATVLVGSPASVELPPYWASVAIADRLPATTAAEQAAWLRRTFACLRPYGGWAAWPSAQLAPAAAQALLERDELAGAVWSSLGRYTILRREGPLPDSADWTHEHADAANTRVSRDRRVKAPLGLLWFGGPPNDGILPRHGHGPQPQVVEGRMFIEGVDMLRATDIYTGRLLWEAPLPGVGGLYDNYAHQPGANASGTNFVATPDGIYVAYRRGCVKLDLVDGRIRERFQLPPARDSDEPPLWGYLNVVDNYLIGGADPTFDPALMPKDGKVPTVSASAKSAAATESKEKSATKIDNDNYAASARLVVLDRRTGQPLWTAQARSGFRHNAICAGGGRLYCIDRLSGAQVAKLKRRGQQPTYPPRLIVYDLATGRELWSTEEQVFGTWLSYSAKHDVLVEAGRVARDTLSDEPKGMRAYGAKDGAVRWTNMAYAGPAMLHHDTILMAGNACELLTGAVKLREHPLSGEPVEWTWSRNYGCNTPLASEHLLTFRSGAAGYFDLCHDGGTGNFGGFRSSCTNNLIVAGGLINSPDYTRTCTCSYQNQTSLALVHMPEVEMWTSFGAQTPKQPIQRVGINLAAPGDRKADDGTLWLELPSVGGASPILDVELQPASPESFRRHHSQVSGAGWSWVAASGVIGLKSFRIKLHDDERAAARNYTVRLVFLEPEANEPGERRFDVTLQGTKVLSDWDVLAAAGGRHRGVVREFSGVEVRDELQIELKPDARCRRPQTVLSGIEILAEEPR